MKAKLDWEAARAPLDCGFCLPRSSIPDVLLRVAQLSIATLYLEKIQTYRGHCVLVFDPRHVTRIDELTPAEWAQLAADIHSAQQALVQAFSPDHINVASLGQVVPHLHWHIVPRYVGDPRWGGPIWTTHPDEMNKVYLRPAEYEALATTIRGVLA